MTDQKEKAGDVVNLPAPRPVYAVVEHPIPLLDTARFEHLKRVADALSYSTRLPQHWRGKTDNECVANALVLLNLAQAFEIDPIFLAQETFLTPNGQIGYTGKLIAANLERKFKIVLDYDITGEGDAMTIVASGKRPSDGKVVTVKGTVGQWKKPRNENWTSQPEDMLIYRATRQWARRYFPAAMLGMLSDDDMDELRENMRLASRAGAEEGRDALVARLQGAGGGQAADIVGHVARETGQTIENDEVNQDQESADASPRQSEGVAGPNPAGSGRAGVAVDEDGSSSPGADRPAPTHAEAEDGNKREAATDTAGEGDKASGATENGGKQPPVAKGRSRPPKEAKPAEQEKPKDPPATKPAEPEWMADLTEDQRHLFDRVVARLDEVAGIKDGKQAFAAWKDFRKDYRDKAKAAVEGMPLLAQDFLNAKMDGIAADKGY